MAGGRWRRYIFVALVSSVRAVEFASRWFVRRGHGDGARFHRYCGHLIVVQGFRHGRYCSIGDGWVGEIVGYLVVGKWKGYIEVAV